PVSIDAGFLLWFFGRRVESLPERLPVLATLLSTLGLGLPAGLNAWLPFLVLSLADRYTTVVELDGPFEFISSTPGLIIILLLLPIELIVDKIPGADHISDLVHTFVRPVAGAILAAAVADASGDVDAWLGAAVGGASAGATHAAKMSTRPVITASTGGVGNPVASVVEDFITTVTSIIAVFLPLLLLVVLPLAAVGLFALWQRLKRGSERLRAAARRSSPTMRT
ncbi:MAG TPA: DUF4126 domain-containing protein, partial [Thermomicrobiales bacterium]|nr:DUF4126 domain-containing protein [Thermomicrobiales bacterium]